MEFREGCGEQPWAFAHRKGFKGNASGLYFHYFKTQIEAEKSAAVYDRKKKWHGPVEYRPGESYVVGSFVF